MPRTSRTSSGVVAAALAIALAAGITACTGPNPDPDPSPIPSPTAEAARPTPAPTPNPAPEDDVVTDADSRLDDVVAMVARPEALELVDGQGDVIEALDYLGDAQYAVDVLTEVVGSMPEAVAYEGTSHTFPGTIYTWDDAVSVRAQDVPEEQRTDIPWQLLWPRFMVSFDTQRIRGIELTTSTGAQVGNPWERSSTGIDPDLTTCYGGLAAEFVEQSPAGTRPTRVGVAMSNRTPGWEEAPDVTLIIAPVVVGSGCA